MSMSLAAVSAGAQINSQVIIANGGVFGPGNLARMGAYSVSTGAYVQFDSVPARSVQHVLIHGRDAFVCADSFLLRYNLDNLQREAIVMVQGLRQTAVYQNSLLVAKGYGAQGDWLEKRSIADLSLEGSVPGISGECEGIAVVGDTAYVGVPVGFGAPDGKLAVVDLQALTLAREIDLDSNGRLIKQVFVQGDRLYTVNQIDFFGSYGIITEYVLGSGANVTHHVVPHPLSQGAGIDNGLLYANIGGGVGTWSLAGDSVVSPGFVAGYWAANALDSLHGHIYVTETDYLTYGKLHVTDLAGTPLDTLDIGVSPEAIAVDYGLVTAVRPQAESAGLLRAFPNPFRSTLQVDLRMLEGKQARLSICDLSGKVVAESQALGGRIHALEAGSLPAGAYLLHVQGGGKHWVSRVLKLD